MIQPGVTEHYLGRVSPFGDPWISARCGSPGHIVACHVLHRLLAPRHPPRALCSLTPLGSSPRGKCRGDDRGTSPCHVIRRNRSCSIYCRSRLHLETCACPCGRPAFSTGRVSSDPLVGDLESARGHGSEDGRTDAAAPGRPVEDWWRRGDSNS